MDGGCDDGDGGDDGNGDEPSSDGFTFSELFAGVGGFGVALRSLGGTPVFASELCGHARRTYLAHHGGSWGDDGSTDARTPLVCCGDITDVCGR